MNLKSISYKNKDHAIYRQLNLSNIVIILLGGIHEPYGQQRGRGVIQMTTLLHKPYSKGGKRGRGKNSQKIFQRSLWMSPNNIIQIP